ncbi:hypothetical protein [Marinoscillum sp.]|uniref:hypothetical protein n=1 Tax=Marinoscillum sp. TaxID=2024838 RepID=UPI003BAAEEC1
MSEEKEKKYRRISLATSIGIQLVLLLLFYFLIAWKEPFPPIPSYGIELSFGVENVGSSSQPVTNPDPIESEDAVEEQTDESNEENVEQSEEVETTEPVEESSPEESTEEVPLTDTSSPDVVEKAEEVKEKPKEEPKPKPTEQVKKPEPVKEKSAEVNQEAVMPKAEKGEVNDSSGQNDKDGREGKEEGTIDGRALMGEQGSSTGASLQMSGWVWDFKPEPKDNSSEEGKIVYKIKVDQDGYIIGIDLVSSTVSPTVERFYKQSIERLSFSKTNEYRPAPTSSGTITFIIKAK